MWACLFTSVTCECVTGPHSHIHEIWRENLQQNIWISSQMLDVEPSFCLHDVILRAPVTQIYMIQLSRPVSSFTAYPRLRKCSPEYLRAVLVHARLPVCVCVCVLQHWRGRGSRVTYEDLLGTRCCRAESGSNNTAGLRTSGLRGAHVNVHLGTRVCFSRTNTNIHQRSIPERRSPRLEEGRRSGLAPTILLF